MPMSREAQRALREIINMIAKYGRDRFYIDIGGESRLPPGEERIRAFDEAIQRMHAEAPSVLQNLASMPKDPYYQAMYGLAELEGRRQAEASMGLDELISEIRRGRNIGKSSITERAALLSALAAEEEAEEPVVVQQRPARKGAGGGSAVDEYMAALTELEKRGKLVKDLLDARANLYAVGDERGAEYAEEWIQLLSDVYGAGRKPAPQKTGEEEEAEEGKKSPTSDRMKRLEAVRRLLKRFREKALQ